MARALPLICFFALALSAGSLLAQAPAAQPAAGAAQPSIIVSLESFDGFYADLKFLFDLAKEPKAYKTLKDTLDVFIEGTNRTVPVVAQFVVQKSAFETVLRIPVDKKNLNAFIANINTLDVNTKKQPGKDLWSVKGLFAGWMSAANGYVYLAKDKNQVTGVKVVPAADLAQFMTKGGYDLGAHILNDAAEASQKERRAAMKTVKTEITATLKQKKGEDPEVYGLRKLSTEHQLEELERFYVESAEIVLGWTTDAKTSLGRLEVHLTPIAGTPLETSAKLVSAQPSYFAAFQVDRKAALSGLINFPADDLRKAHLTELFKLSRPVAQKKISEGAALSDKQKTRATHTTDLIYDVLDQVIADGNFDGFIDMQKSADGLHNVIGGLKAKGESVSATLKKYEDIEHSIEKVGEVDLHSLPLDPDSKVLSVLFGKGATLYIGTSTEAVWYAVGKDGLERLKTAITELPKAPAQAGGPHPALAFHAHLEPLVRALDARPIKKEASTKKLPIDIALETFREGEDVLEFELLREDDKIVLHLDVLPGVLRYVGKIVAKNVNENLN